MDIDRGKIVTFYSFKGGVGRSMALANVAALLSEWGRSVLVVDWDLEAPGIERFFSTISSDALSRQKSTPGVLDLVVGDSAKRLEWHEALIQVQVSQEAEPI